MSALLAQLRRFRDNRGLMADLRCALVREKRHRAWPALGRLNVDVTDENAAVVSGLFATHPEETHHGNFGATCRTIQSHRGESVSRDKEARITPTERRFQHLLAAEPGEELHKRVTRFVLLAKSQGVPVNFVQLEKDLTNWSDRVRAEWAGAFWTPAMATAEESGAEEAL